MNAARIVMFIVAVMAAVPAGAPLPVPVTPHESAKRVDIAIGGKPFTLGHLARPGEKAGARSDPQRRRERW